MDPLATIDVMQLNIPALKSFEIFFGHYSTTQISVCCPGQNEDICQSIMMSMV
jgi:hypothetical protein